MTRPMTNIVDFQDLLERRAQLEAEHTTACEILAEEGRPSDEARCARLYRKLQALELQIASEIATENRESIDALLAQGEIGPAEWQERLDDITETLEAALRCAEKAGL